MIQSQYLERIIDLMGKTRVLVIGDVMLDMYEHCEVKRISPEAPVPIATVISDSFFLGGAGNVANNAKALGAYVSLVSVVGDDRDGLCIRELLSENGINHDGLIVEQKRYTTLKKRVVSGIQQLLRIDREMTIDITQKTFDAVCIALSEKIPDHDVVIISDYCKGFLTEALIQYIKEEAKKLDKKIFVDSKSRHLPRYADVYLIKPNKAEAELFVGEAFTHNYRNLEDIGKSISLTLGTNVVVTLGGDGMALFENGTFLHTKTKALQVFDVSGAGDTVLSVIAVVVATGGSLEEAVNLSNIAAGYVVSRLGTTICDQETLRQISERKEYE